MKLLKYILLFIFSLLLNTNVSATKIGALKSQNAILINNTNTFWSTKLTKLSNDLANAPPAFRIKILNNLQLIETWEVLNDAGVDDLIRKNIDEVEFVDDFIKNNPNKTKAQVTADINTQGYTAWKLAQGGGDLLTTLKSTLNNVPTNLLNKLDNWSIDELTRLESHLNKYPDLAGELSNPKLFDAVETIVKNPENAWDALRDLKNADIVSETVNRIGKSSFFTDVIGKGRVFEQSVLDDIIQGFTSKSGTAYNVVKTQMATLGKNIDDYVLFKQVQFDVPGGKMIADQVLVKYNFLGEVEDVIILENKLKSTTNYTTRQISGWKQVNTQNKLTIRSVNATSQANSNTAKSLTQGSELINISNVIRVDGGSVGQFSSVQATIVDLSKF